MSESIEEVSSGDPSESGVISTFGMTNGLISDFTTGDTLLELGSTGLLTHNAALVSWVTNENEFIRLLLLCWNALFSLERIPLVL